MESVGLTQIHRCKFCNGIIRTDSEYDNIPEYCSKTCEERANGIYKHKDLKYQRVYDNKSGSYVYVDDIDLKEDYYFGRYCDRAPSCFGDTVIPLSICRATTRKKRNGGTISVRQSAKAVGEHKSNTTSKNVISTESLVHKLCKEEIQNIKYIRLPGITTKMFGEYDVPLFNESMVPVKFVQNEKIDDDTGRIPDSILKMNFLGVELDLYVEFYYTHRVPDKKVKQYRFFGKNAIEIDLSAFKNYGLTEKELRPLIKKYIEVAANRQWISSKIKYDFDNKITKKRVNVIDHSTGMCNSTVAFEDPGNRRFIFKDKYVKSFGEGQFKKCNCYNTTTINEYGAEVPKKSIEVWECLKCNRCLGMYGYNSTDNNARIYCAKVYDGVSCKLASSDIIEKGKTNLNSLYHKMMSEVIDGLNT